jgi:hypothetical protein
VTIFEVQSGGKTYEVDAPDQSRALDAFKKFSPATGGGAAEPPKPKEDGRPIERTWLETIDDWASSVGSGISAGVQGTLGLPGDVERGVDWLADTAADVIAGPPKKTLSGQITGKEAVPGAHPFEGGHIFPTSSGIEETVDPYLPKGLRSDYQPKSTVGKYLKTVSEFAPGAVGPKNLIKFAQRAPGATKSLVESLVRWGVVPGTFSEWLGEKAEGTKLEETARIAGALIGGGGSAAMNRTAGIAAKSIDDLATAADRAYQRSEQAGVIISPQSVRQSMTDLALKMNKEVSPHTAAPAFGVVTDILRSTDRTAGGGLPVSLKQLDQWRQWARSVARNTDPEVSRAGMLMIDHIDEYIDEIERVPTQHIVPGMGSRPEVAIPALKAARKLWQMKAKGETIEDIFHRAELRAKTYFTKAGIQHALGLEFKNLAVNKKRFEKLWTKDEQKAILRAAGGDSLAKALQIIGKLAIRGNIGFMTDASIWALLGPQYAIAAAGLGEAAKYAGAQIEKKAERDVSTLVRGGTPRYMKPVPAAGVLAPAGALAGDQHPLRTDYRDPRTGLYYRRYGDTYYLLGQ